jgi:hypothetical protein
MITTSTFTILAEKRLWLPVIVKTATCMSLQLLDKAI